MVNKKKLIKAYNKNKDWICGTTYTTLILISGLLAGFKLYLYSFFAFISSLIFLKIFMEVLENGYKC